MTWVIPAIDILEGNAVRLREGKREQVDVFHREPWLMPAQFAEQGATRIHLVNLDGAFGTKGQHDVVERVVSASPVPVQLGGGIRDRQALEAAFTAGVDSVVLGTAAIKDPGFAREACTAYPGRIIIAVDAKDGVVAVHGWTQASTQTALELAQQAVQWGAEALLYTDISRDGMHTGVNVEATKALIQALDEAVPVIASGGVASLDDIRALAAADIPRVVVGRALYENRFTLPAAIAAASESHAD